MPGQTSERPIEIRAARTTVEVEAGVSVLDSVLGAGRGWQLNRARLLDTYLATPGLLSVAVDGTQIVGGAGCDGVGVIDAVAVLDEWRGQGLGRRLLERVEAILRARGATAAGLGSLDGAVAFYLSCGYQAQLLVQFAPEVNDREVIIAEVLAGPLAGREVVRREWQGHPQLWLQDRSVNWELKRGVEDVAAGVVAQYVMNKHFQAQSQ